MANEDAKKGLQHHEDTALSLFQLIGAPLQALVQAESQAADATAEFIRSVGFEPLPPPRTTDGAAKGGQAQGAAPSTVLGPGASSRFGQMRMARFQRVAPDGTVHRVEVPLLSLVPIPALQIKEANLEFAVKVVDTLPIRGPQDAPGHALASPIDLKGAIGRPAGPGSRQSETQMRVKVTVQQADLPAGLARLFNLLDQHVAVEQQPPLTVHPPAVTLGPGRAVEVEVTMLDESGQASPGVEITVELGKAAAVLEVVEKERAEPRARTDARGKAVFVVRRRAGATSDVELAVLFRAARDGLAERVARLTVEPER